MKQKKVTIYLMDGTQEEFLSKKYYVDDKEQYNISWWNYSGYCIKDENDAITLISPSMHKKVKIEEIDA